MYWHASHLKVIAKTLAIQATFDDFLALTVCVLIEDQGKQRKIWSSGGAVRLESSQTPGERHQLGEGREAGRSTSSSPRKSGDPSGGSPTVIHPPIVLQLCWLNISHSNTYAHTYTNTKWHTNIHNKGACWGSVIVSIWQNSTGLL